LTLMPKFSNISGHMIKEFSVELVHNAKYKAHFLDSMAYLSASLDNIAVDFNLPNKITGIDYENIVWDINNKDHVEYCINDSRILYHALGKFNSNICDLLSIDRNNATLHLTS